MTHYKSVKKIKNLYQLYNSFILNDWFGNYLSKVEKLPSLVPCVCYEMVNIIFLKLARNNDYILFQTMITPPRFPHIFEDKESLG